MLSNEQTYIIENLVGKFDQKGLENLATNISYYLHPKLSIFVPLYNYCHYAVAPNHSHPAYSFILYLNYNSQSAIKLDGEVIGTPKEKGYHFAAISPNVAHQEINYEGFSSYYAIMIERQVFENIYKQYNIESIPDFRCKFIKTDKQLLQLVQMFMFECAPESKPNSDVAAAIITQITHKIIRDSLQEWSPGSCHFEREEINRAVEYIYKNCHTKITTDNLAEHANLSLPQFNRVFKELTHKTPNEYIKYVRIEKAKQLLKASTTDLTQVALDCGFSSSSYFSHCFIEAEGLTPSMFRKKFLIE